jgi:hypothetical protein
VVGGQDLSAAATMGGEKVALPASSGDKAND